MAFSSGKSKAKREAKKAEQKALLAALAQAKKIDPAQQVSTNQTRQLKSANPDVDYSAVRLAMQADRLARQANGNMGSLNKTIGLYNTRLDQYTRQRNGESITEYQVEDAPQVNAGMTGMASLVAPSLTRGQYSNEMDAIAEADKLTEKAQAEAAKPKPALGVGAPQNNAVSGLSGLIASNVNKDPATASVKEVKMGPITGSYRTLPQTRDAYNDLSKLSKQVETEVGSSGLSAFSDQYATIGERLKNTLKRQQTIKSPGLIDQEIYKPGQALPDIIG